MKMIITSTINVPTENISKKRSNLNVGVGVVRNIENGKVIETAKTYSMGSMFKNIQGIKAGCNSCGKR